MRSTLFVGSAAAALLMASAVAAQTTSPAQPEATNPSIGPAMPAQPTTPATTPPYRGATAQTPPAGAPRLEKGATVVSTTGATVGEVVSVDRAADGTVTIDLRTSAGVVKTLPVSAFGSREGQVATTWTDAQIAAAPAGKVPPAAAPATPATPTTPANPPQPSMTPGMTPPAPATPATPATPARPGVTPATPATPAQPAKPDEQETEDEPDATAPDGPGA